MLQTNIIIIIFKVKLQAVYLENEMEDFHYQWVVYIR